MPSRGTSIEKTKDPTGPLIVPWGPFCLWHLPGPTSPFELLRRWRANPFRSTKSMKLGLLQLRTIYFCQCLWAEEVGFEPTVSFPTPVFKTGSFGRSDTPPSKILVESPPPHFFSRGRRMPRVVRCRKKSPPSRGRRGFFNRLLALLAGASTTGLVENDLTESH